MFVGVDVAGEENTWAVVLSGDLTVLPVLSLSEGRSVTLYEIVKFFEENTALAVAIDAPLTFGLMDEGGFRESDRVLREILKMKGGNPNWVVSYHVLQAVPVRGLTLAEALSPLVGTLIETHPRASLFLSLPKELKTLVQLYKRDENSLRTIWRFLVERWQLRTEKVPRFVSDGIVDALVCAITAYLYHKKPEELLFLPPTKGARGRGPFVVISDTPIFSVL